jgi:hypothetical protein
LINDKNLLEIRIKEAQTTVEVNSLTKGINLSAKDHRSSQARMFMLKLRYQGKGTVLQAEGRSKDYR